MPPHSRLHACHRWESYRRHSTLPYSTLSYPAVPFIPYHIVTISVSERLGGRTTREPHRGAVQITLLSLVLYEELDRVRVGFHWPPYEVRDANRAGGS